MDKLRPRLEDSYMYQEHGIRNDYLYEIEYDTSIDERGMRLSFNKRKHIIGEILNFGQMKFAIKSYDELENNHYIISYNNIINIQPYTSIEEYKKSLVDVENKTVPCKKVEEQDDEDDWL